MKVLIITDSYPPEVRSSSHLMAELAEGLAARGHQVVALTSYPNHNLAGRAADFEESAVENGVQVVRVKTIKHHNVGFVRKGISQLLAPFLFYRALRRNCGALDAIIFHSPPLPLSLAAGWAKRRYGARYILNLHDFFPQNAIDLGVLTFRPAIVFFRWLERRAYKAADLIMVPSAEHKTYLAMHHGIAAERIAIVPHWVDLAPFENAVRTNRFRTQYGLGERTVILFAGNFGPSQGLDLVLELARRIRDLKDLVFFFVGDGTERARLVQIAEEKELANVVFAPLVPKEEYPELVRDADVGLVSLTSLNTTPAVPAKLLGYMAAGLPVLAFLHKESDILNIVAEAKCGWSALSDDMEKMEAAARSLCAARGDLGVYGARSLAFAKAHFAREACLDQIEKVLGESQGDK